MDIRQEIEDNLKKALEGKLFVEISMSNLFGNSFIFSKDWYTVKDGIVYHINDGKFYATEDTCFDLNKECKNLGTYNPDVIHKGMAKNIEYSELKQLLKF